MKKLIAVMVLAVFILPLSVARPAYASDCSNSQSVFGGDYTLSAGETLDRNLVVLGGSAAIEDGAEVNCSVVVFGGSLDIAGTVEQDVTVFGGSVNLRGTAVVNGKLSTLGGSISRDEGAQVKGGESQGFGNNRGSGPAFGVPGNLWFLRPVVGFFVSVFNAVFVSVGLGLLALVVVLFWPDHTARVSAAVTNAPAAAGGLGLLTVIAVPILVGLTAITLCLIPISFVGALVFAAAIIFGWLALGMLVGARLTAALHLRNLSPAVSAALGTFLFTLVALFIGEIPCVGWVVPVMLGAVGLGAVALTRFGTRPYLTGLPAEPAPPAPPAGDMTVAS